MNKEMYFLNFSSMMIMLMILFLLLSNIKKFHPIIIMINLLIYSMMICLNLSIWKSNYLYSIMLFLIMISGLLIIFLYFSSLISNEQINIKFNWIIMSSFVLNLFMFMLLNLKFNIFNLLIKKYHFNETNSINKFNLMNFQNILNLYEYPLNNITISSMFYLLMSLFSIIKICSMKSLSLRKIN